MKKSISFVILTLVMTAIALLTSCGTNDGVLPDSGNEQKPTITEWVEPFHVKDASIEDVKSYMATNMPNYYVSDEVSSVTGSQLAYTSDVKNVGILYSFIMSDGVLYSVISTELNVNKEVILKYLYSHYTTVPGTSNSFENIQYMFTNEDKSIVIHTEKVSDTYFNVCYSFITK